MITDQVSTILAQLAADPVLLVVSLLVATLVLFDAIISATGMFGGGFFAMVYRRLRMATMAGVTARNGSDFRVVLAGFDRVQDGAAFRLVNDALERRLSPFLFGRGVQPIRVGLGLRDSADMAQAQFWMQRHRAEAVVWGTRARDDLWQVLILTALPGASDHPAWSLDIAPPENHDEAERLQMTLAYFLSRLVYGVAEAPDRFRTEKLTMITDKLNWLCLQPPSGLGEALPQLLFEDMAAIALSLGQRLQDRDLLVRAAQLRAHLSARLSQEDAPQAYRRERLALGRAWFALGLIEQSERRLRSARDALRDGVVDDADALTVEERMRALIDIGRIERALGDHLRTDAQLIDAMQAFRAALALLPSLPDDTADARIASLLLSGAAHRNLASALLILSDFDHDPSLIDTAIGHFRQALGASQRLLDPRSWAKAAHGLGLAHLNRASNNRDASDYRDAVHFFQLALEERRAANEPQSHAESLAQLGHAQFGLGRLLNDDAMLQAALATYRACDDLPAPRASLYARSQLLNNLGNAHQALGELRRDPRQLEQAIRAYYKALQLLDRDAYAFEWAGTQNNLGNALHALGEMRPGTTLLVDALRALKAALQIRKRETHAFDWASTRNNMGLVLATLASRERDLARLGEAQAAFAEAEAVFLALGARDYAGLARQSRDQLEQTRGWLTSREGA
jgi:tetratricopeptide (TPR) repeat protein